MKTINFVAFVFLLSALGSPVALADFNNSSIYIVNKTARDITVSQPIQTQWNARSEQFTNEQLTLNKKSTRPVGQALVIKPGTKQKVAALGRDQELYTQISGPGSYATSISFTTDNWQLHTFTSTWRTPLLADLPSPSELTYNKKTLPFAQKGMRVHTYFQFFHLYPTIELVFDPLIKP